MRRFFISYASDDRAWAEKVVSSLACARFESVCQYKDFKPGCNFVAEIHRALQETQCTILLLSPDFLRSPYTEAEWTASWALDPTSRQGRLWPVMIRECRPPGLLAALNYTNLVDLSEEEAQLRLVKDASRIQEGSLLIGERISSFPSLRWTQAEANYRRVVGRRQDQSLARDSLGPLAPLEPYMELEVREPQVFEKGRFRRSTAFEAYSMYNRTIFLGDAGSGKSTFLSRLALDLARGGSQRLPGQEESASRLPVLLSLWKFSSHLQHLPSYTLWDYILFHSRKTVANEAADVVEKALKEGRATVLLDGLDEVPAQYRVKVSEAINDLMIRSDPKNRFAITCRSSAYNAKTHNRFGCKEFELAPLNKLQIEDYVDLWEREARRLQFIGSLQMQDSLSLHELIGRPEVRPLVETPMLLSLISQLHYRQNNTELSRFHIFDGTIDELLWNQEKRKGEDAGDQPQIDQLLESLHDSNATKSLRSCLDQVSFKAIETSGQNKGLIPRPMVLEALTNLHPAQSQAWARELLDTLKLRTGLFQTRSEEEEGLRFSHLLFQEFMAGAHLSREKNFARTLMGHLKKDKSLRDTLLAAVSHLVHQKGELEVPLFLAHALCEEVKGDTWLNSWTAGDILLEIGANKLRGVPTGNGLLPVVCQRLAMLLQSGGLSPVDRTRAGDTLGQLGDPRFSEDRLHLPLQNAREPLSGSSFVPPGPFFMGSTAEDPDARDNELGNPDALDITYPFWISRFLVTVDQYETFIKAGGYNIRSFWSSVGWKWRNLEPETHLKGSEKWLADFFTKRTRSLPLNWEDQRRFKNRPVTGISWFEARAYAAWLEKRLRRTSTIPDNYKIRLPTEDEWEKSARGVDGRRYPWKGEWHENRSNSRELGIHHPTAVGIYPLGLSPYEVEDMAGNVQQWTLSRLSSYPYLSSDGRNRTDGATAKELRIVRGGSFLLPACEGRCATRSQELPHSFRNDLGFRVVLSTKL